jgi:hypothetical protein
MQLPRTLQRALSLISRFGKPRRRKLHRLDPLRRIYLSPF